MKTILNLLFLFSCLGFISCSDDDDLTTGNADATGSMTYVRKSFIPLSFDSTGTMPLSAMITMEGTGNLTQLGIINLNSTFKFDFVQGKGSEFQTTYTGPDPKNSFQSVGSSQVQPNGSIVVTETLKSGKGQFAKMSGSGTSIVILAPDGSAGTGTVQWKVSY